MDFGNRISEAQGSVNASKNTYNEYAQQAGQAGDRFNSGLTDYGNTNYGDLLDQSTSKYLNTDDMQQSRNAYQNARGAVSSLNATMEQLPASITGQYKSSGVMMNEAQRQRALQYSYSNNQQMLNNAQASYATASDMYDRDRSVGMQLALAEASGNDANRLNNLNALQNAWSTLLGQRNTAYSQNQADRGLLAEQYGARDQNTMFNQELDFKRWQEQQANARAAADRQAQLNLQSYLNASNERIAGLNKPQLSYEQQLKLMDKQYENQGLYRNGQVDNNGNIIYTGRF